MRYGYARVSTNDQNLARQIEILKHEGIEKIFTEKASGALLERPVLQKAIHHLKPGDELVVSSLDRLSRDADHLTTILVGIHMQDAKLVALDVPNFDEVKNENIQRLLRSMIMEVKKFMAAEERAKILERQMQGIKLAKNRGIYKGRPVLYGPNVKDDEKRAIYLDIKQRLDSGESLASIHRCTGKSLTLIRRIRDESH